MRGTTVTTKELAGGSYTRPMAAGTKVTLSTEERMERVPSTLPMEIATRVIGRKTLWPVGELTIFPTEIATNGCGEKGHFCDDGKNPSQTPTQSMGGHRMDRGDIEACIGALRQHGHKMQGSWPMGYVEKSKDVTVFGANEWADNSRGQKIVILKTTNVLGHHQMYRLYNPQALYCVKSVAVFDQVTFSTCWSNNVVFLNSVSVGSHRNMQYAQCQ